MAKNNEPIEMSPGVFVQPGDIILLRATVTATRKIDPLFGDARVGFTCDGMHYAKAPLDAIVEVFPREESP